MLVDVLQIPIQLASEASKREHSSIAPTSASSKMRTDREKITVKCYTWLANAGNIKFDKFAKKKKMGKKKNIVDFYIYRKTTYSQGTLPQ